MKNTVNGEIELEVPEGFHVMTQDELDKAYADQSSTRWGMSSEEKHITVSVFWHASNALLSAIAGPKDACKGTEKKLRKALGNFGYSLDGFYTRDIGGKTAYCFRHQYRLKDVDQVSDVCTLKLGKVCYTIYCYTRKDSESENRSEIEGILDSIRVID